MIHSGSLFLVSFMVMLSFLMLMQTRITALIVLLILQNILGTSYLLAKTLLYPSSALYFSLAFTFLIKVIVLPWLLWKLKERLQLSHHIEPLLNKATLQFLAILMVIFALLLSHQIESFVGKQAIIGFSLSLANSFLALLMIIFRHKTISQIVGLLALENSIFLISATLTTGFPWIIELGMGFDILVGFMIFGLFLFRIQTMHGSLHTYHVEKLRERI